MVFMVQGIVGGEMVWLLVIVGMFLVVVLIFINVFLLMLIVVGMYLFFDLICVIFVGGIMSWMFR